ncbi:hypothetical protein ACFPMF_10110 [Larkinella bovis]|uniref:DUF1574 domain-containing protein n=1 Tax=Larkinella bovis TaxID=683041 RepID=A0ABW0I8J9_9BACT
MLRFFLKILVLVMVMLGLKITLWARLQRQNPKRFDESGYKLDSMLKPVRHRINTVFVGSSRTMHSINPAVFDSVTQYQTRSFNHGLSALFAPNTFAECEKLLKMDGLTLKTIFLELSFPPGKAHEDPFSRTNPLHEIGFKTGHFVREEDYSAERIRRGNDLYDSFLNQFFTLRSSVFMSVLPLIRTEQDNFIMDSTGYRYFRPNAFGDRKPAGFTAATPPDTTALPVRLTERDRFYLNQLMQLIRQCDARKVSLYVYLPNRPMAEEKQILPNVYAALPDRYRIAVPYRREYTAPFPDDCSDDQQHLNQKSATLYSLQFAQAYLQKRATADAR